MSLVKILQTCNEILLTLKILRETIPITCAYANQIMQTAIFLLLIGKFKNYVQPVNIMTFDRASVLEINAGQNRNCCILGLLKAN